MKKSLLICMVTMLIFGLMGFGFAMWADTVTVEATVETGTVEIGIRDVGTNDNIITDAILGGTALNDEDGVTDAMELGGDPQIEPGVNTEGKNVAVCTSENGDYKFTLGETDFYDSITETITNAYPYYAPTTKIEIASNGSIPVKIDAFNVVEGENNDFTGYQVNYIITYPGGSQAFGDSYDELLADLIGTQLHQGDVVTLEIQTWFDQSTNQGSSGELTFSIHACQWNEYGQDIPADQGTWNILPSDLE